MELRSRTIGTSDTASMTPQSESSDPLPRAMSPSTPTSSRRPHRRASTGAKSASSSFSLLRKTACWLVHFYTATGLLVDFYALQYALVASTPDFALFAKLNWLAILIDATDGTMARALDIRRVVPGYDGALLDNIIDFLTFSLLPALALVRFNLVQDALLANFLAAAVLLSSAYAFCQTIAKTPDSFVGFPSYWNIVVIYIYYLQTSRNVTVAIILLCAVLSFVPIHFIYPTKTRAYHTVTLVGAYIWGALMLVPCLWPDHELVKPCLNASLVYVAYYVGMSLHLDYKHRERRA